MSNNRGIQKRVALGRAERTRRAQRKGTDFLIVGFNDKAHEHLQMITEHLKNHLLHLRRRKQVKTETCKQP